MRIAGPTPFRRDRVGECSRVISEAIVEIERQALEAGWTPSEISEALSRYAEGAKLRALPRSQYARVAQQLVNSIVKG